MIVEMTLFCCTHILAGAIVYLTNDSAGVLLITAGCALAAVWWIDRVLFKRT